MLKRLPNSIDANRILAQLWLHAGQPAEAEPFSTVSPNWTRTSPTASVMTASAPADAFELPMLEYTAERHASRSAPPSGYRRSAQWKSLIV